MPRALCAERLTARRAIDCTARVPSLVATLSELLARAGLDATALGLGFARAMPSVAIVPAFGLRALPPPTRAVLALALGACALAASAPAAPPPDAASLALRVAAEVARGLPVAIAAAVPLWAATMAGGVADALRGASDAPNVPVVEGRATPLGAPLSILASAIFLTGGGPARVAAALAAPLPSASPFVRAAEDLTAGIGVAVALGGPLLAASVVVEVGGALVARSASPAQIHALLAPLRALAVLAVMAIVLERLTGALERSVLASLASP